jgi:hypothetical protein
MHFEADSSWLVEVRVVDIAAETRRLLGDGLSGGGTGGVNGADGVDGGGNDGGGGCDGGAGGDGGDGGGAGV